MIILQVLFRGLILLLGGRVNRSVFSSFMTPLSAIVWSVRVSSAEFFVIVSRTTIVRSIAATATSHFIELVPLYQRHFSVQHLIDNKVIALSFQWFQFCFNSFDSQLLAHFRWDRCAHCQSWDFYFWFRFIHVVLFQVIEKMNRIIFKIFNVIAGSSGQRQILFLALWFCASKREPFEFSSKNRYWTRT